MHAVGKNSKMAITPSTRPSSTASSKPSKDVLNPLPPAPVLEKGKEVDRALPVASSSATPAAATKVFGRTDSALEDSESELPNSMDPPAARAASSRRSSASGSQPSRSPLLLPTHLHPRLLRSPSPAPLPAVHLPPSPKMAAAVAPSVDLAGSASPGTAPPAKPNLTALYSDPKSTPFFRRLCWSTDGSLLLTPAGLWEDPYADIAQIGKAKEGKKKAKSEDALQPKAKGKPTVYIYSRGNIERPPIAHLPGHQTTSIAIRFCPVLWELREGVSVEGEGEQEGEGLVHVHLGTEGVEVQLPGSGSAARAGEPSRPTSSLFDLPYRMVYAVATLDAVFLYDTQQAGPICMFGNLHYAPFTDLSWFVLPLIVPTSADSGTGHQMDRRWSSRRRMGTARSLRSTRSSWAHRTSARPSTSLLFRPCPTYLSLSRRPRPRPARLPLARGRYHPSRRLPRPSRPLRRCQR